MINNNNIILPPELLVNHIFPYLNLHELGISGSVSKGWRQYVNTPPLWQSAIYQEFAFSSKNWADWDAELVKNVDITKEMSSLPINIAESLDVQLLRGKAFEKLMCWLECQKGLP